MSQGSYGFTKWGLLSHWISAKDVGQHTTLVKDQSTGSMKHKCDGMKHIDKEAHNSSLFLGLYQIKQINCLISASRFMRRCKDSTM